MGNIIMKVSAVLVGILGVVSLFMTSSIIFDLFEIREKEGNYVPFIVYANFVCSFLYLYCSYGFFTKNRWTTILLFVAVGILILAYIALIIYIQVGGIFEMKTVKAMLGRISLTIVLAGVSWYYITRTKLIA
jgi:hypothetical protein